jgi:hypothetical protein
MKIYSEAGFTHKILEQISPTSWRLKSEGALVLDPAQSAGNRP